MLRGRGVEITEESLMARTFVAFGLFWPPRSALPVPRRPSTIPSPSTTPQPQYNPQYTSPGTYQGNQGYPGQPTRRLPRQPEAYPGGQQGGYQGNQAYPAANKAATKATSLSGGQQGGYQGNQAYSGRPTRRLPRQPSLSGGQQGGYQGNQTGCPYGQGYRSPTEPLRYGGGRVLSCPAGGSRTRARTAASTCCRAE